VLNGKPIEVDLDGEIVSVLPEEMEVRFEAHEGFAAAATGGYVVAIDTAMTPELISEGLVREFVRRVQALRKDADLKVDDRIKIAFNASKLLAEAIASHRDFVMTEILASEMEEMDLPLGDHQAEHSFENQTLLVALSPEAKTA